MTNNGFRRERALSKRLLNADRTSSQFSMSESPTSTWSPTESPTHLISSAIMDEPLALVKKMHQEAEEIEDKNKKYAGRHIQVIDSVIKYLFSFECE